MLTPFTLWVKVLYGQSYSFPTGLFYTLAALFQRGWGVGKVRLWSCFVGSPAAVWQTLFFALMSPRVWSLLLLSICLVTAIQAASFWLWEANPVTLAGICTNSFQVLGLLSKELERSIHTDFQKQQDNFIWSQVILLTKEETLSRLTVGNLSKSNQGALTIVQGLLLWGSLLLRGRMEVVLYFDR